MVLFLMFFPGFGCIGRILTVDWCQRNVPARNVCLHWWGAYSLKWHPLCISFSQSELGWMVYLFEKDHAFSGSVNWKEKLKRKPLQTTEMHPGFMPRYSIGFSLSRNSSGAIGWYFIIYGISCGEYFESVHTRKLYVCMCF